MNKISKIIIAILTVIMITVPVLACAAPSADMKVFILEDFESASGDASLNWSSSSSVTTTAQYKNGAMNVTLFDADWVVVKYDRTADRKAPISNNGVEGFGMYIENNTSKIVCMHGVWIGAGYFINSNSAAYYTIENGNINSLTFNSDGILEIQPGFKGYILFPWTSFGSDLWGGATPATDISYNTTDSIAFYTSTIRPESGESFIVDNILLYGSAEMEGEVFEMEETADISVIAYAAMAITGLGALVISKRR